MYGKEKTGLRRLWECDKTVFAAGILALVATIGQLASAYLFYLPGFANMKPFTFLMYTVIRWLLLSLPAYLLSAYLEDHYGTENNPRYLLTAGISAVAVLVLILMNGSAFIAGFLAGRPEALSYSVAMTLLFLLPVAAGISLWQHWQPLAAWIAAGACAAAMVTLAILNLLSGNLPSMVMALSYVALCVAYAMAMPKILSYVHLEQEEDDSPSEAAIMKDEE